MPLWTVTVALFVVPDVIAHVSPVQHTKSYPAAGTAVSVALPPRATQASASPEASPLPNFTPPVAVSSAYARNFAENVPFS